MRGFAAEFCDLNHYIRVITERIWEGRRIDDIRLYYSDPCVVETPMSVSTSIEDVVNGTRATLAMFPDRRLLAEDVIASGDADGGFLSSHRIISTMTHLGDGSFGKATGRRIHARTIADCVCKDNRIVHEWLVRDQSAIALQIGSTPQALAQIWLDQRGGWTKPVAGPAPAGYVSHISTEPLAAAYAQALQALAHGKEDVTALYDDAAQQIGPGEASSYGHAEIAASWRSVFGALQVQQYTLEHLAMQRDMANSGRPDRVALRFRAQTLHTAQVVGAGRYGTGSGRPVELLGIVHAEFVQGRVMRECLLLDDVAIWMQVLAPQA
ncbi:MAG: ester cyclase [Rhodoferax sp.]|nr:ester cyclase [Rhodoferax sp.]